MTVLDANHWSNWRSELLIAILLLWAGMVLGVAFLAVPVQFGVSGLSRPLAFDIVRHVMSTFGWVQLGIAGASLLTALLARPHAGVWFALATAWAILALQAAWLLPVMAGRVDMILAGQEPPPGPWHRLYEVAEVVKLGALLLGAWLARCRGPGT